MANEVIGIVGAGTMGAGIAQLCLEHGHEVVVHDVDAAAIERGRTRVREGLARRAVKLGLDADSTDDWVDGRLSVLRAVDTLDGLAAGSEIVIEAALEDLELKREIFRALDAAAGPDTILATNTSALSVGAIGGLARHRERIVGLHFFNPAPLMPLVEVVAPADASELVVQRAETLVAGWDKTAVRCADEPGFIVNRVNRPFTLEALAIVEAGEASIEEVDEAVRAAGFPMGPFELMDLVGIDVNLAAARSIWEGFGRAARFRPSPVQEALVAAGRLGRKTGSGFYRYEGEGRLAGVADDLPVPSRSARAETREGLADRIWLAVVAEACRALDDEVATAAAIDTALRLGAGHPRGPFERLAELGGRDGLDARLAALAAFGPRFEAVGGGTSTAPAAR